jgi:hypothetical protein
LDANAKPFQGLGLGETVQIHVGHLQVGTVIPLFLGQGVILKTAEMFFVVHGIFAV